jgi:hypothetical protein
LQTASGPVNIGLSYDQQITDSNRFDLALAGHDIHLELLSVDALLIGDVDASEVYALSQLEGVVMVERYGSLVFYGDVQTPAVKARNSTESRDGQVHHGPGLAQLTATCSGAIVC